MDKKKSCNVSLYLSLVILLLITLLVFLSNCSFAITTTNESLIDNLNIVYQNSSYNWYNDSFTTEQYSTLMSYLSNYDNTFIHNRGSSTDFILFNGRIWSNGSVWATFENGYNNVKVIRINWSAPDYHVRVTSIEDKGVVTNVYYTTSGTQIKYSEFNGFCNTDIYNSNAYTTILTQSNLAFAPGTSITLEVGLNQFHRFQGIKNTQQLLVYLQGYELDQFNYYVQRYIDNEWETFTTINDYYVVYDTENDVIYENPYYIVFQNITYFPAGTYRYMATGTTGQTLFSTTSSNFTITDWSITGDGTVTGTIDNGQVDLDITIDNGSAVEGIVDFLSEDSNITENEFSSNFPSVEIEDPSEDFFSWVFDNIEDVFTSSSEQTFTISLFTNNSYTISSSQVSVPSGVVKTLIGLFCDFSICYWIIKDVRKVIIKIKKGSIESIAEEDITANMV